MYAIRSYYALFVLVYVREESGRGLLQEAGVCPGRESDLRLRRPDRFYSGRA